MTILAFAGLGLIFGSFATVAGHRIPRRETVVSGRSKCPNCDRQIKAHENIPVLSWILLRGRCAGCKEPISVRYPLIELGTGILFALSAAKFGFTEEAFIYAAFFWVLVVLTVIDLDHKLLPDRVVYPAFVVGWIALTAAALVDSDPDRLVDAAIGSAIFGGFFFVVAFVYPAGMGGGDIKLAFVLGTFIGYLGAPGLVLVGMFLSFLIGALGGMGVMVVSGKGRKSQVPFGPFLAAGTVVAIMWGQSLLDLYLDSLT